MNGSMLNRSNRRDVEPAALDIATACTYTGIGRSTLYELIRKGEISTRKLGTKTLILRSEADRFLASLPVGARAA